MYQKCIVLSHGGQQELDPQKLIFATHDANVSQNFDPQCIKQSYFMYRREMMSSHKSFFELNTV